MQSIPPTTADKQTQAQKICHLISKILLYYYATCTHRLHTPKYLASQPGSIPHGAPRTEEPQRQSGGKGGGDTGTAEGVETKWEGISP